MCLSKVVELADGTAPIDMSRYRPRRLACQGQIERANRRARRLGRIGLCRLGMRMSGNAGAIQILAYVASGVGFLGAGVIIKEGTNIRGSNTAATIWCSADAGAHARADREAEAVLLAFFILAGNIFLRPLVAFIERRPIDERAAKATFEARLTSRDQFAMQSAICDSKNRGSELPGAQSRRARARRSIGIGCYSFASPRCSR